MVAGFDAGDAAADFLHDAAALVAENHGKHAFGISARQGERVGMAYAGCDDAYQHFPGFRSGQIDFFDAQGFIGFPGNSRSGLH